MKVAEFFFVLVDLALTAAVAYLFLQHSIKIL